MFKSILSVILLFGAAGSVAAQPYTFTTFAGFSGRGSYDGIGSAARFNYPTSVATDSAGNLYVADQYNHTIRKITPTGMVTTLAGLAGITGSADGTGSAARFNQPYGVATDSAGNVYVGDFSNFTIRKITPAGVVTTLAGLAGFTGSGDGAGSVARFNGPNGIATDSAGNVYVADTGNHTIRKITPTGVVITLAGLAGIFGSTDGTGNAARFYSPTGVATDSAGYVYVADTSNHTIRKITPAGVVTTLAGLAASIGSTDGIGSAPRFNQPYGVVTDSAGNVYIAEPVTPRSGKSLPPAWSQPSLDYPAVLAARMAPAAPRGLTTLTAWRRTARAMSMSRTPVTTPSEKSHPSAW